MPGYDCSGRAPGRILDGSARGGVLVALAEKFALPVHAVGVGEGLDDLRPFEACDFANSLMGLEA